ncbi:nuclear transport factor 2 family protein [Polymorphobacter arshaanensis]|nr:nuclear transport factor 2 family protein [Polymorphobacter arshaanensis]
MHKFALAAALTLAAPVAAAPAASAASANDTGTVLAVIDSWFAAMRAKDRPAFEVVMQAESTFIAMRRTADGWTQVRRNRSELADALLTRPGEIIERFIERPTVLVHGPIATVWGRYEIGIDGKRLHCGVDSFNLIKDGVGWKIANASWTIEPEGCPK